MRIKCRGYEGHVISMDGTESIIRLSEEYKIEWYDIAIRSDDGAKIVLTRVRSVEIEVQ